MEVSDGRVQDGDAAVTVSGMGDDPRREAAEHVGADPRDLVLGHVQKLAQLRIVAVGERLRKRAAEPAKLGDLAGHDDVRAFPDVDLRPWDEREAVRPEDASFVRIRAQQVLVDGLEVSGVEELGERDAVQPDSLRHPDHPLDRS